MADQEKHRAISQFLRPLGYVVGNAPVKGVRLVERNGQRSHIGFVVPGERLLVQGVKMNSPEAEQPGQEKSLSQRAIFLKMEWHGNWKIA